MIYLDDGLPIIACSTGTTSNTAISKIRIGGFENLDIFAPFFNIDLRPNEAKLVEPGPPWMLEMRLRAQAAAQQLLVSTM